MNQPCPPAIPTSRWRACPKYPLRFREILRDYSFGQRWIARAYRKTGLPEDHRLGETWEVCDRPGGESSPIVNGELAGLTLRQAIDLCGAELMGRDIVGRFGRQFPLLIKLLDATHSLGEQCHTNDELTRARGVKDFSGKTEAWYMLHTRAGATVRCGNTPGLTARALTEALLNGQARTCMNEYPAAPGDAFLLYAGAMHYSPGGLLFYEIMQNSDVYVGLGAVDPKLPDEQRRQRTRQAVEAVHLEEGFDPRPAPVRLTRGPNMHTFVLACQHFALERLDLAEPAELFFDGRRFGVLTVVAGAVAVSVGATRELLESGQSCLLPACAGQVRLAPQGPASVLIGYVPDLRADVIDPLRQAGVADAAIAALGGKTRLNPLLALL